MNSLESFVSVSHQAVSDMAAEFHLRATTNNGIALAVPCGYQIAEPGFRPFRSGKGSPEELQAELDAIIGLSVDRNIDLGIETEESVRKLAVQNGLGIDCSNFALRTLVLVHERLQLPRYTESVFRPASDIQKLHEQKGSWVARDDSGNERFLTLEEAEHLRQSEWLSIDWIAKVFGKDPEFITGSQHIASEQSAVIVKASEALPGDIIAFRKAGSGVVSHVAMIEAVDHNDDEAHLEFWHAWHTRDFESGLKRDSLTVNLESHDTTWSHQGLTDPSRYQGHHLVRPQLMHDLLETLS